MAATHLNFDGGNDIINCGSSLSTTLTGSKTLTVEAWIRSNNTTGTRAIVSNHVGNTQFDLRTSGTSFNCFLGLGAYPVTGGTVVTGTWQHVAMVYNNTSLTLYVNGVSVGNMAIPATYALPASADNIMIGNTGYTEPFNGDIDEIRIWNTALSADDIARTRFCELQGNETGLLRYYKFNQGINAANNSSVTTLTDATANANNGTLTNFSLTGATSNWLAGSPVTTGSTIPAAPTASAQSFCGSTTVANLVPAPSATIKWYNAATGGTVLAGTTAVSASGTYYVAAANANGCESARTPVSVTVNATTLAGANQNSTLSVTGTTNFPGCANLIAKLSPNGASPVNGNTTAKVWIEGTQNTQFAKRHYEITPATNAATATGRITLYFTQANFDDFNAVNTVDLPTGPADATGIANLKIEKRSGISSDGTGLPSTYTGSVITIDPADADIVWNSAQNRWEISFDVTGFSGFFIKTLNGLLPLNLLSFNGSKQPNNDVLLQWQTTHEVNSSRFEIEISSNGNSFVKVSTVTAKNTAGISNYAYTDNSNWTSDIRYYRLKMIDNNGKFNYSTVLKMNTKQMDGISIYPNPVTDAFVLNTNNSLLNTSVKIMDMSGSTIMVFTVNSRYQNIDISYFAKGMYMLRFVDGNTVKLIKQ